jgi:hypothetical protein
MAAMSFERQARGITEILFFSNQFASFHATSIPGSSGRAGSDLPLVSAPHARAIRTRLHWVSPVWVARARLQM